MPIGDEQLNQRVSALTDYRTTRRRGPPTKASIFRRRQTAGTIDGPGNRGGFDDGRPANSCDGHARTGVYFIRAAGANLQ